MIRYALLCENDHAFDGWFRSSSVFDEQVTTGEVACAICGSAKVRKALMAPNIARSESAKGAAAPDEAARKLVAMMTALKKHVEENCDYVGDRFADVARAIHYEEEPRRDIYGEATLEEARELIEEGVEVAPLPMATPRQVN